MMPFELVAELFEIATQPWSLRPWSRAKAPSAESIARIQRELGMRIPEYFVRLATACPSYGAWLAGIGDDLENPDHILKHNRFFHDTTPTETSWRPLPPHLIMLNHGYDGDCDCWDTRVVTAAGEHPIVYICVDDVVPERESFQSFAEYAENF